MAFGHFQSTAVGISSRDDGRAKGGPVYTSRNVTTCNRRCVREQKKLVLRPRQAHSGVGAG